MFIAAVLHGSPEAFMSFIQFHRQAKHCLQYVLYEVWGLYVALFTKRWGRRYECKQYYKQASLCPVLWENTVCI